MENFGMPTICIKCKNSLTDKEKEKGLPLCQYCIGSLTDTIMGKMRGLGEKKIEEDVDNFSRFILSSGNLFKLDEITIIQCCFNIFMRETTELEDKDLTVSEKIFTDAIHFMERELDKIEDKKTISENPNGKFFSMFDEIIKKGMKSGNGSEDNIIKDKEKDNEDNKKEENKKEDKEKDNEDNKKNDTSSNKRIKID